MQKKKYTLKNVNFMCKDYKKINKQYDIVILQGVLEHLDNPFEELLYIKNNLMKKYIITSSPSFINPRGYTLMTLALLLDVPVSLTDKYFICPFDIEEFCEKNNLNLEFTSTYLDWAAGESTIRDFNRRLRNALKDANLDNSKVDRYLEWLSKSVKYFKHNKYSGAMVTYKISNK